MKLKLQNILKVESADIELGGLTVLTGENNSGKSTVGKILFTILKAVNNVRQVDKYNCAHQVFSDLSYIRYLFRRAKIDLPMLENLAALRDSLMDGELSVEKFEKEIADLAWSSELSARTSAMIRNRCNKISGILDKLANPGQAVKSEFDLISKSEFQEPLCSYGCSGGMILFHDDTTDEFGSNVEFHINDNKIGETLINGEISIDDVTYIESPLYLHILNTLRLSRPMFRGEGVLGSINRDNIPYHLADMAEKLLGQTDDLSELFDQNYNTQVFGQQLESIASIIGGEFVVDNKTRKMSFIENDHDVPTVSVASGIKSFGVMQRLIRTDCISTSKILIWDEPEIHLHPEWQIQFCRLIIELVSLGVPVVISSHSPYFIQGLRYFASAMGVEKDVKYYMAVDSENPGLSRFKEVSEDLNSVFSLLAAPLREIMNVDAVRNSLK